MLSILDAIAPFHTAEQWDNVGLMVGDPDQEISTVVVALDPSFEAISFARDAGADCIITHHPLFFEPMRCLNLQEGTAKKVSLLVKAGISLLSMHTNLDLAPGGVADVLARELGLEDVQAHGMLRTGTVRGDLALSAWTGTLPFTNIRLCDAKRAVHHVCACPGSGMSSWREALEMGCDTFVTGDVRYHAALDAIEAGMNVIDLGHYGTEKIIVKPFMEKLHNELQGMQVIAYEGGDVFTSIEGE